MLRLIALALVLLAAPAHAAFKSDRISVTAAGRGPDVVLVPGLTSSPAAWKYVAGDVPGYRYHYVQVKGFAGTPAEGNARGDVAKSAAEEIARYITQAHLKRPAIVGHSMGGLIALMVAARHPQAVSRVMVVDMHAFVGTMIGGDAATPASIAPAVEAFTAPMARASDADYRARLTAMFADMTTRDDERPALVKSALDSDRAVVGSSYRELFATDLRPELVNITVPATVLYVTPRGIPVTDSQIDAGYRSGYANLRGVRLVRIPDSAHFIMYDARARFAAELKAFLAG